MRVLVCGGRDFTNLAFVWSRLDKFHAKTPITEMIQGGAPGVDTLANEWAKTKAGIKRFVCRAEWTDLSHPDAVIRVRRDGTKYDAKAGSRRNARMLKWKPDIVIAFEGGSGTANMCKLARAAGVEVVDIE
jgi:hypothetical protein